MKVIFVAGAYSGANAWEVERNVRVCEEASLLVSRLNGVPICLNVMGRFWNGTLPYDHWIEAAKVLILRSDAVFLSSGWQVSSGVPKEIAFSEANNRPVLYTEAELRDYLAAA